MQRKQKWLLLCMTSASVCFVGVFLWFTSKSRVPHAAVPATEFGQCIRNLKQLGISIDLWHDEKGRFPESFTEIASGTPVSWRVRMLPFIERDDLFAKYEVESPWNSKVNIRIARERVATFICPAFRQAANTDGLFETSYGLVVGQHMLVRPGRSLSRNDVVTGLSNSILVGECCGLGIVWSEPRDIELENIRLDVATLSTQNRRSEAAFTSYHKGGAFVLLADGSVRFMHEAASPEVLRSLTGNAEAE